MKKNLLLYLLLICLVSCNYSQTNRKILSKADEYKFNPDSLSEILHKIEDPDKLSDKDLADFYRLSVYNKFHITPDQINESTFDFPIQYYTSVNDTSSIYEMYILIGSYWLKNKDYTRAFQYLNEGYQLAQKNKNYEILDRFCELLGGLNIQQNNYVDAIKYFNLRLKYNNNNNSDIYYDLALIYAHKGDLDSVRANIKKSLLYSNNTPLNIVGHRLRNFANILYEKQKYQEAIDQLRSAQTYTDSASLPMLFASLSASNLCVEKFDSAIYYCNKANLALQLQNQSTSYNYASHKNIIMTLEAVISYKTKKHFSIYDIGNFNDSIAHENMNQQEIIQNQIKDKNRLETDILKLKLYRQKVYLISIVLLIAFLLASYVFIIYSHKKSTRLIEIEEKNETLQILLNNSLKGQQNESDDLFFKKILLQQLGIIKLIATNPTSQNQDLLQQMTRISNQDINVESLLVWEDLYPIIDSIYNGFYSKITKTYGDILIEKEIQLCCLLCAEFSTKEISVITQQSVRTIYQRKTTIRQKLLLPEKGDIITFLKNS